MYMCTHICKPFCVYKSKSTIQQNCAMLCKLIYLALELSPNVLYSSTCIRNHLPVWTSPFRCEKVNALTLYPWIHQFSNNKKSSDQTRPIRFPDVNPQSLPLDSDFSMVAGDFVEVYTDSGALELMEMQSKFVNNSLGY